VYSHLSVPVEGQEERPAGWSNARLRFEVARLMQEERLTSEAQGELTDAVEQSKTASQLHHRLSSCHMRACILFSTAEKKA
jgi:hypothetical protein